MLFIYFKGLKGAQGTPGIPGLMGSPVGLRSAYLLITKCYLFSHDVVTYDVNHDVSSTEYY